MVTAKQPLMFLVIIGVGINCAQAQMPQRTTATYDDWTISCTTASGGEKSCEVVQSQIIQGQAAPASQITIARSSKGGTFMIFFQVPPNVWLQTGVRLRTDDKDPGIAATFRWCTPTRCLADANLTDAAIKKLNEFTDPGHLSWKDPSQQDVHVPVSFKGFSPAVNAMNESQSSLPLSALGNVSRFDGQWLTEAECQAIPPNVAKSSWKTTSKVENGKLFAKFGDEGKSGSGKFEGVINPDGHLELSVIGLTGDSKYTSDNAPEKTPYNWRATGSFSGATGTAKRIEGRFCTVNFSKSG